MGRYRCAAERPSSLYAVVRGHMEKYLRERGHERGLLECMEFPHLKALYHAAHSAELVKAGYVAPTTEAQ